MQTVSPMRASLASKAGGSFAERFATIDQYSVDLNASISRSRSTTSRTATDWTRPADRPRRTLSHSSGDTW